MTTPREGMPMGSIRLVDSLMLPVHGFSSTSRGIGEWASEQTDGVTPFWDATLATMQAAAENKASICYSVPQPEAKEHIGRACIIFGTRTLTQAIDRAIHTGFMPIDVNNGQHISLSAQAKAVLDSEANGIRATASAENRIAFTELTDIFSTTSFGVMVRKAYECGIYTRDEHASLRRFGFRPMKLKWSAAQHTAAKPEHLLVRNAMSKGTLGSIPADAIPDEFPNITARHLEIAAFVGKGLPDATIVRILKSGRESVSASMRLLAERNDIPANTTMIRPQIIRKLFAMGIFFPVVPVIHPQSATSHTS